MNELTWPFLILSCAFILFVLEIFIPSGGVLGALSGLALAASVIAAYVYGGLAIGTSFMAGTALLIPVVLYLAIKVWPRTPIGRRILISPPTADEVLPANQANLKQWLDKEGVALTPMLPAGAIRIGRKTLDAISDGVTIEKGAAVQVYAIRGNYLVVRPATRQNGSDNAPSTAPTSFDDVIPDPFDDSLS